MRFQFDSNQSHQLRAIEAVADLFRGQPRVGLDSDTFQLGEIFSPVANRLDLAEEQLLDNLRAVQRRHAIPDAEQLEWIGETITTARGEQLARFPNFSVEMETGTGKTYVYIRSALELHRRYGMRKFIIVVPSVAVREGVLKSLKITQDHLRALYDNVPYRFTVYESRSIAKVRQFAQSDCVELLVMTIDSFNKDDNVIRQSTDRLQGSTPIHLVQATRPVLILDEPQALATEIARNPSCLDDVEWRDLERVLREVFEGLGFDTELTRPAKDGGFDLRLTCIENGRTLTFLVEVKHWIAHSNKPGLPVVTALLDVVASMPTVTTGVILSSSGFRNSVRHGRSEIEQHRIRLGGRDKIVSLCQNYVEGSSGVWEPVLGLPDILLDGTW